MGVVPLHWDFAKKFPDFMILPQNCIHYHKKSSDIGGNEVHTQQQPATRVSICRELFCGFTRVKKGNF